MTPAFQLELLRLLQEREYERLGSTITRKADVRFVAATHRNLEKMVAEGTFREDLFYRLNVVPITAPPLRERRAEIPELAHLFCREHAVENERQEMTLADSAVDVLVSQPWPGNVRQLQNFVERLVVLGDGPVITDTDVLRELARQGDVVTERETPGGTLGDQRRNAEKRALVEALESARNNRSRAARILGVSRRTLYNKLHEHGLV